MAPNTTRCYHGTPHKFGGDIMKSIQSGGLKYFPALTNNFAMAAWHALKDNHETGVVFICDVDVRDAEYGFCRGQNENKKVYKFKHVPPTQIVETVVVMKDQNGMAKIVKREDTQK